MLERPRLVIGLVLASLLLSSSALFIGFYLDDYVARYIYTDLDGAHRLFRLLNGGYGLATGVPAENHWQMEQGYAPWWMYEPLRLSLYRPLSLWTHVVDATLWYDNPFLMHLHSLAWLALLVVCVTRLYRSALGLRIGGMAALLFAVDHTHGFVVGFICNRHTLVTGVLGALCLHAHLAARRADDRRLLLAAPIAYLLALLSGEAAIAIGGYIFAYELLAHEGSLLRRALAFAPYAVITVVWRVVYTRAGYGASGSGLYIDPGREPLHYLAELAVRGPILLWGLFFGAPAELYMIASPAVARSMLIAACILVPALGFALVPLFRQNRLARFWAAGMLFSLVPAASTFPHSRQLLFASFGGLALIAQIWHLYAVELKGFQLSTTQRLGGFIGTMALFAHLVMAPFIKPVATASVAFATPLQRGVKSVGDELAGKDAIFMTAPDYFATKIVQLSRRADKKALPRRWRTLSFGPQVVHVTRADAHTLVLDYEGGILATPFLELYRDRRLPMPVGQRVTLQGLVIEVLATTPDGRPTRARFTFDTDLDAPSFQFYEWRDGKFVTYHPPAIGEAEALPPATLEWGLS